MAIKDRITDAAEITILAPIDNNYKTGGGDISIGGCMVIANKGKPFTPYAIYGGTTDIVDVFGTPLPKKTVGMEGLRHLADAAESCSYVNAARVVNATAYRYPSIALQTYNDRGHWDLDTDYEAGDVVALEDKSWICINPHTSEGLRFPGDEEHEDWEEFTGTSYQNNAHRYNEDVICGEGVFLVIYPIDGDTSVNRSVAVTAIDEAEKRITISVYDKDELGEELLLESLVVGIGEDDKDDMGLSAYIETVFERESKYFRVDFHEGYTWEELLPVLKAYAGSRPVRLPFVGGNSGGAVGISDWELGLNVFRNERVSCNLLFAAGIYEPDVIVAMAKVADERHIAFFYDVPPSLKCEDAMEWDKSMGLTSRHARGYYSPYSANDPWRGGKCVWGVSGAMAAAKARCNKIVTVGVTPGVHYVPAGEGRSYLARTGLTALFPEDRINRDSLYERRLNPIVPITSGGCGADDDLTHWFKTNYLRFGWVNDILDYIDHRFYEAAQQAKFEPDGLTREILYSLTKAIMDDLVTSGALVQPRNPTEDGTSPYIITVTQEEIDLWKVVWEICPTGAARRIVGQPKLIR